MAIATAAIFPIPTVADRAVVRDSNGVIIPLSSFVWYFPLTIAKECGNLFRFQSHFKGLKNSPGMAKPHKGGEYPSMCAQRCPIGGSKNPFFGERCFHIYPYMDKGGVA